MPRQQKLPEDLVESFDCEQRSDEWFQLHIGIPTASNFGAVMATGADSDSKMRAKLMNRMAAEILYQRPMDTYSNADMDHGIEIEPDAADHYAFTRGGDLKTIGFIRRTIRDPLFGDLVVGCSPDRLVDKDGLLQIKRMRPDLIVQLVDSGRFPSEHRWQCHGEIWVTGRQWADLKIYYAETVNGTLHQFPISPVYRLERNEGIIADLRKGVENFSFELRDLVKRMRAKGGLT